MENVKLEKDLVSVVITTYNDDFAILKKCIDSVVAQSYRKTEIIVVDDGSEKSQQKIIQLLYKNENLKYIYQGNKGPSGARNTGLKNSCGEFICFLDSDDRYFHNKLDIQVKKIKELPEEFAFVTGALEVYYTYRRNKKIVEKPELISGYNFPEIINNFFKMRGTPVHLYKTKALLYIEGFDENLRNNEDKDLLVRLAFHYKFLTHEEIVCKKYNRLNSQSNYNTHKILLQNLLFYKKLKLNFNIKEELFNKKISESYYSAAKKTLKSFGDYSQFQNYIKKGKSYCKPRKKQHKILDLISYSKSIYFLINLLRRSRWVS